MKATLRFFCLQIGMEQSEVVLYDWIHLPGDWEPDVNTGELTGHHDLEPMTLFSALSSRLGSLLRYSGLSTPAGCKLPNQLVKLLSVQGPWSVSLSPCGQYLAVLRRNYLELRCVADNFATVKDCTQIAKDRRPQWRKIFWSNSEGPTFLALALSNGKVFLFDTNLNVTKRLDPQGWSLSFFRSNEIKFRLWWGYRTISLRCSLYKITKRTTACHYHTS